MSFASIMIREMKKAKREADRKKRQEQGENAKVIKMVRDSIEELKQNIEKMERTLNKLQG